MAARASRTFDGDQPGTAKTFVGAIDRTVEHRDGNPRISATESKQNILLKCRSRLKRGSCSAFHLPSTLNHAALTSAPAL
jgi:hypothetical protein